MRALNLKLGAERHLVSILVDDGLNLELIEVQRGREQEVSVTRGEPKMTERRRTSPESAIVTSSTGLSPRPLGTASIALMTSICRRSQRGGQYLQPRVADRRRRTNAVQDLAENDVLAVEPGEWRSKGASATLAIQRKHDASALRTHQLVTTVQIKNCEPLVSRPALAIESVPAPVCLSLKFSSLNLSP